MIRLILIMAPAVSIASGIGISYLMSYCVKAIKTGKITKIGGIPACTLMFVINYTKFHVFKLFI